MFGVVYKIGDLVANRYRVKDIIGSGGAGVVYRARDQEIDVDVAVKVVNAKLVQTSDEQRLFSRQTKIAKKLSHQNVVRIYDEGRDEQRPYFTMQFLEGLSLRKIIDLRKEKKQTFALSEVEPIFNQLCQALEYAHKTTFHGNLKPDNVIVLPDLLKITDFALLRGLPRKPFLAIQKSRGTNFRYLAPEVRLEVPDLDKSVDVYSLGVVLCEMLTGLVYDEAKAEELNTAGSGLDPSVLRLLKRCLARAPKDRYGSVKDVYEDIRGAMTKGSAGKRVPPPPPPEQHPSNAAEAETQRLDIGKHGDRPVEDTPARPAPDADAPPPPPKVEVSPPEPPREGTASFEIDDDMIEASEAHKSGLAAPEPPKEAAAPAEDAKKTPPPVPGAEPVLGEVESAIQDEDLQDDPDSPGELDDEEETQAVLDPAPELAAIGPGLEEISSSAIELIADPSATNVMRVDRERQAIEPAVVEPVVTDATPKSNGASKNGSEHQTVQPTPLPDSAIPEPAFSSVAAADKTEHGPLTGEPGPVIPRSPTAALEPPPSNGASAVPVPEGPKKTTKKRPMTRPRMSTIQPSAVPVVSTLPSEPGGASARPQTMPAAGLGTIPPAAPPPAAPANNRPLYFTVAASVGTVILALLIVLKVSCDNQAAQNRQIEALREQMTQMNAVATEARSNQQKLEAEAAASDTEAKAAAEAEAEATKKAEVEARAKAEAEAEAKRRAEEAAAAEAAAKATADAEARAEAEQRALEAKKEAEAQRAAAKAAAAREAEAKQRADAERRRREAAQRAKADKERRARAEAEAARKAEARAARLAEEERLRRDKSEAAARAAAERRAEEDRRAEQRRLEEERRKAEEAARRAEEAKKAEEDAKAAAAEEKKALAAATDAPAGPKCPRGMVLVEGGSFMMGSARNDPERNFGDKSFTSVEVQPFCVDYYEYPNGRGLTPKTKVSFKSAVARCKRKGKRLCSEEEWEKACKGKAGTRYPYGNQWDPARCNTEDDEGSDRELAKSGTFRKCYSGYRVFDLSGNAAEWTSTEWGSGYVVKGGASDRPGYDGRCAARKKKKPGTRDVALGFRCCADPE